MEYRYVRRDDPEQRELTYAEMEREHEGQFKTYAEFAEFVDKNYLEICKTGRKKK